MAKKTSGRQNSESASHLIDGRIKELGDWRGQMLGRVRTLIREADPAVVEEWKWHGVLHSAGLQFVEHPHPELRPFGVLDPDA